MAKKKKETSNDLGEETDFDFLADEIGGSVLSKTDSVRTWIDTGNLSLNFLCSGRFVGGGIPGGKMVEIFGNSSSCKTLFALNILQGVQKAGGIAVFIDAEGTISKEFAEKAAHVDTNKVIVIPPEKVPTLEKCFKVMHTVIKKTVARYGTEKPIVIIYDSIAASPSEREFANTEVEEGMSKEKIKALGGGTAKPGERAKTCSEELRTLNPLLDKNNCTVVFINQLRSKIGVMFGNPNTTGGGGRSLEYYTSLRLETRASKRLKDKLDNVIGMNVSVSNQKNKVFRPFVNAKDMHLFFDKGINPFGGLLDLLIKQGRIVSAGAGNYRVQEPWAGGKEIKFKSSLERNDVPPEALLACPALVDATSPDQIQSYLDNFGAALDAVANDIGAEETLADGESMDE
jgi:recombination protein RecA